MMTAFDRMKERLSKIRVYDDDAVVLGWELKAYAAEIDRLYIRLEEMFRERFISTAQDIGLSAYEKIFGPERVDESVEERRRQLLLRINLGNNDFTVEGFHKALESFGLNYIISEFPEIGRMNVIATSDYSPIEQAWIKNEVSKIVPAHIEFQLSFNTLTWEQWDGMNRTFSAYDEEDLTWDQIDNRTASDLT